MCVCVYVCVCVCGIIRRRAHTLDSHALTQFVFRRCLHAHFHSHASAPSVRLLFSASKSAMSSQLCTRMSTTIEALFNQMGILSVLPPNWAFVHENHGLFTTSYGGANQVWKCQAQIVSGASPNHRPVPAPTTEELFAATQIASKLPSDRDYFIRMEFDAGKRSMWLPPPAGAKSKDMLLLQLDQGHKIILSMAHPEP